MYISPKDLYMGDIILKIMIGKKGKPSRKKKIKSLNILLVVLVVLSLTVTCGCILDDEDDKNSSITETPTSPICEKIDIATRWKRGIKDILVGDITGDKTIKKDGSDWTEISIIITNKTESKIILHSVELAVEKEAENIFINLVEEGNYTIGPGDVGKQIWKFKIYSQNEICGEYDIYIFVDGIKDCHEPLKIKVVK